MASPAALAAFPIVVLLAAGHFQVALPSLPGAPGARFDDSAAGAAQFVAWLQPRLPAPRWNEPPRRVCVVAAEPFTAAQAPYLPKPLYESSGALHALEPYTASFDYVAAGAPAGTRRTLAQALARCAARPPGGR